MLLKKCFLEKRKGIYFVNEANTTERKIVLIQVLSDPGKPGVRSMGRDVCP